MQIPNVVLGAVILLAMLVLALALGGCAEAPCGLKCKYLSWQGAMENSR